MFFKAMTQESIGERRSAVTAIYNEIVLFSIQHNELACLVNTSSESISSPEIIELNKLAALVMAITNSFPELGINDFVPTEHKANKF